MTCFQILSILLTVLSCGGLQVKCKDKWIEATPIAGTFVCNLGDMLERLTGGLYLSTPHRVRRTLARRLSIPFFVVPNWDSVGRYGIRDNRDKRYDKSSVHSVNCTFGEYVARKYHTTY